MNRGMADPAAPLNFAPDFTLPDHQGQNRSLSGFLGPRAAILVFYRGHWCPYCRRYLAKLARAHPQFQQRSSTLVAISPEPCATSAALVADLDLPFPLLSDINGKAIDAYGVRNRFTGAAPLLPHPAVFILRPDRSIHFKSIDRNYKRRTPIPSLFRALDELSGAVA